jgi:hypothetical protein
MANNTSKVFIDIITEFTGTKSVKQAESSFNKLAKSIAGVVSVAAIERFSRESVKAFLADDAAAKQLEKTLTNLGVYFDAGVLSSYIQGLQDTTGVLDDQLRPAFQSLAVATGDYTKAQDLLNTALDVSQATGKSLSSVSTALSRAYLGNYTAVSRLGAGISKAEIAAGDFNAIQEKLNKNFGGSALAAADTYAGQLRIIKAAFTDVQETIGEGLVDAFTTLIGPDGSATQFAQSLKDSSLYIADIIRGLGVVASKLKPIESFFQRFTGAGTVQNIPVLGSWLTILNDIGKKQRELSASFMGASPEPAQIGYAKLAQDKKNLALAKKLAAEEKKKADAAKKTAKAAADKLKSEKANALLNAAAKVLDIDQAQILAALSRDLSEDEKNRLKLQRALLNENEEAAGRLAQTILASQTAALLVQKADPFGGWNDSLQAVLDGLEKMIRDLAKLGAPKVLPTSGELQLALDASNAMLDLENDEWDKLLKDTEDARKELDKANALAEELRKKMMDSGLISGPTTEENLFPYIDDFLSRNRGTGQYGTSFQNAVINVMLDPNTLTGAVTKGQQDTTASGIVVGTSRINKLGGGF